MSPSKAEVHAKHMPYRPKRALRSLKSPSNFFGSFPTAYAVSLLWDPGPKGNPIGSKSILEQIEKKLH